MNVSDYNYELPEKFIAQVPLENRSDSKLMVMNRQNGELEHSFFYNLKNYLQKGDVLVLNNTKVLPARLFGIKEETNAHIELLLLKNINGDEWECLAKPAKRLKIGTILNFNERLKGKVIQKLNDGIVHVEFMYEGIFIEILEQIGLMPLPPYIHEKLKNMME